MTIPPRRTRRTGGKILLPSGFNLRVLRVLSGKSLGESSVICPSARCVKNLEMATSLQTPPAVNPDDPLSAKQIVTEYARVLNRDLERGIFPAAIDSLPFAKPTIKI